LKAPRESRSRPARTGAEYVARCLPRLRANVAGALLYRHLPTPAVIRRDLKPENVMATPLPLSPKPLGSRVAR
jgi:hypothetical protein